MKNSIPTLSSVLFDAPIVKMSQKRVGVDYANSLNMEIASFGYTFDPLSLTRVGNTTPKHFEQFRVELVDTLREMTGEKLPINVLFTDFPHNQLVMFGSIMKKISRRLSIRTDQVALYSCGHLISKNFATLWSEGKVCNHCRFSNQWNPQEADRPTEPFSKTTPLKVLNALNLETYLEKVSAILGRQSSLSDTEKALVADTMKNHELDLPAKCFKETLPFVYAIECDVDYVKNQLSGATDVMRLAYYVSDKAADLSLKDNTKFKLKNRHIRDFLGMLDGMKNLEEDLMRHRERWLRLGEIMHPTSDKNKKKYPNVAEAFVNLRNYNKDIATFNRSVEAAFASGKTSAVDGILRLMKTRPAEFARRLDALMRTGTETEVILAFEQIADKVPGRVLYALEKHFMNRDAPSGKDRTFVVKGKKTKMKSITDERQLISTEATIELNQVIVNALIKKYSVLPPLGKVFIEDSLEKILIPLNKRGESEKTENVFTQGSHIKIGDTPIVRLFVWWKDGEHQYTDIDLSCALVDENFAVVDHVAYTNLTSTGVVHSGDVRGAPEGAFEFIDFNKSKMKKNVRYVVSNILMYSGPAFKEIECYAGFMEREEGSDGKLFEPASLSTKVRINGSGREHALFAYDIKENRMILLDLEGGNRLYQSMYSGAAKHTNQAKNVVDMINTKPTLFDVLEKHVLARGEFVDKPEDADVVYDMKTLNMEDILAMID